MKKLILIAFILLISNVCKAQDLFSKRSLIVKGFVSAVFKDKKDTRFIMDNYMCIKSYDTISAVKKEAVIAAMIGKLKTDSKILASAEYKLFNYDDFKEDKKKFNTDDYKDIIILAVKNKAVTYFYFNHDRLISFFYIEKGSSSFFLTI